jgi:hypothetical protein
MSHPIRICTVATPNYLPFARVLAQSLQRHHRDASLLVLMVEPTPLHDYGNEPFEVITLAQLGDDPGLRQLAFQYNHRELAMALKGRLHEYVLERTDWERWLFLDADIMIWAPLDALFRELDDCTILLSPHSTVPYGTEHDTLFERELFKSGVFNGGMVGVRRSAEAAAFVRWFRERLDRYCFDEYLPMLTGDQSWLTLVPAFFRGAKVSAHPGANVAFWNVRARRVERDGDRFLCDGEPLLFFHYSGLELPDPTRLSRYEHGESAYARPEIRYLVDAYVRAALAAGYVELAGTPCAFTRYADGRPIRDEERRAYYEACKRGTAVADPFGAQG